MKQKIAVGGSGSREQPLGRDRPGLDGEVAVHDEEVLLGLAASARAGRAEQAVAAERADERAGHDADAAMAERVQMIHRLGGGRGIVDVHARDSELWAELAAVDDRRASRGAIERTSSRRCLRQAMAEEDQAVGFLAPEHQRVAFLAFLVVLRVAEQHGIALALRRFLDAPKDQREERVGDVRHGHEQLARSERPQVSWRRSSARRRGG